MKPLLILILSFSFSLAAFGQAFSNWTEKDFKPDICYRLPLKFDSKNTWLLSNDSSNYYILDTLVLFMKMHPNLIVEIDAHTIFNRDDLKHSKSPTQARAEKVVDTLIKLGIDPARLKAKGWSYTKPLISQNIIDKMKTQQEKDAVYKVNFRTEFRILSITYGVEYPDSGFTNKAEAKNLMINGLKEGKWLEYVNASNLGLGLFEDNDTVYKLTVYKGGNPFGIVRIYKLKGELLCEVPFKSGKENGIEKEYGKTDRICILEIPWIDGKINGIMKEYYESGKMKREAPYSDSEPNGIAKEYYEDGKLMSETTYTNNIKGITKYYDENGNEIKK